MMSTMAPQPVTTPIPVQLSEPEFEAFILPHLSASIMASATQHNLTTSLVGIAFYCYET